METRFCQEENNYNMKQTYANYYKKYYDVHKKTILENSREYRKSYNKKYYEKNKEIIKLKRIARKNDKETVNEPK